MLELQQTTTLRLQVNVPETYSTQLEINQNVFFTVEAIPGKKFSGTISRKSGSVDDKFRNEAIEIDVANSDMYSCRACMLKCCYN